MISVCVQKKKKNQKKQKQKQNTQHTQHTQTKKNSWTTWWTNDHRKKKNVLKGERTERERTQFKKKKNSKKLDLSPCLQEFVNRSLERGFMFYHFYVFCSLSLSLSLSLSRLWVCGGGTFCLLWLQKKKPWSRSLLHSIPLGSAWMIPTTLTRTIPIIPCFSSCRHSSSTR